jgi:hypothetical protein
MTRGWRQTSDVSPTPPDGLTSGATTKLDTDGWTRLGRNWGRSWWVRRNETLGPHTDSTTEDPVQAHTTYWPGSRQKSRDFRPGLLSCYSFIFPRFSVPNPRANIPQNSTYFEIKTTILLKLFCFSFSQKSYRKSTFTWLGAWKCDRSCSIRWSWHEIGRELVPIGRNTTALHTCFTWWQSCLSSSQDFGTHVSNNTYRIVNLLQR